MCNSKKQFLNRIIFFIGFLLLFSCNKQNEKGNFADFKNMYENQIFENYPFNLDSLQHTTDREIILYPAGYYAANFTGVFFIQTLSSKNLEILKQKIGETDRKLGNKVKIPFEKNLVENLSQKPIFEPDYNSEFIEEIKDYLDPDHKTFVFLSKKGNFVKNKYKHEFEASDLNHHGYSQGVTVNDRKKTVLYWIIIW